MTQVRRERDARLTVGVELSPVRPVAGLRTLGGEHCELRVLEQGLRLQTVVGKDDDAHAQVEMHGLGTHEKWLLQKTEDAFAGSDGLSTA